MIDLSMIIIGILVYAGALGLAWACYWAVSEFRRQEPTPDAKPDDPVTRMFVEQYKTNVRNLTSDIAKRNSLLREIRRVD